MKVTLDEDALVPVIQKTVIETLKHVEADRSRLGKRLAFAEAEAAALMGVPHHVLRDCRLRGEVTASKIGRKIVYSREELQAFLENTCSR